VRKRLVLADIPQLRAAGVSLSNISQTVTSRGFVNRAGKAFSTSALNPMVKRLRAEKVEVS
jgi:hypothetical protein